MRVFFLFVFMLLNAGCSIIPGSSDGNINKEEMTIKAMTFNIRVPADPGEKSWEQRKIVAAKVITSRQPDVVGFQELVPQQRDDLLALVKNYSALGLGREKDTGGESCAVFYLKDRWEIDPGQTGTFWYSDTPEESGSISWGNKWVRICTWARLVDKKTGRGIYVYNSHWDFSEDFHRKAAGMLQERIALRTHLEEPLIVMGDFNSPPRDKWIAWLLEKDRRYPLEDVWVKTRPGEDGFSFHNFSGNGKARIDYLLASKGKFSVINAEVICDHDGNIWPSDHFPVWAELKFK